MAKGTDLERTSQFIQDAHAVGLSIRTTAMLGYPGEAHADVAAERAASSRSTSRCSTAST